jgi:hypothetical protein
MSNHFEIIPRHFTIKNTEYTIEGYTETSSGGIYVEATYKGYDGEQRRVSDHNTRKMLMEVLTGKRKDFKHGNKR